MSLGYRTLAGELAPLFAEDRQVTIHDAVSEVFLPLFAANPAAARLQGLPPPEHLYAILCDGRTGSTLLCEMLAAHGAGKPQEHIREAMIRLCEASGAADVKRLWQAIVMADQANGVFGTKIIFSYWKRLLIATGPQRKYFEDWLAGHPVIFLYRRDRLRQAISTYMAQQAKIWHVRGDRQRQLFDEKIAQTPFDFDKIDRLYRYTCQMYEELREYIPGLRARTMEVAYEDLIADPWMVEGVARFVAPGRSRSPAGPLSKLQQTGGEKHEAFAARFSEEARSRPFYQRNLHRFHEINPGG